MSVRPECPICFEADADLCLPCNNYHWIHRTCWNSVVNKTICPVCRQNVIPPLEPLIRPSSRTVTEEKVERLGYGPPPRVRTVTEEKVDQIALPPFRGEHPLQRRSTSERRNRNYSDIIDMIHQIPGDKIVKFGLDLILSSILVGRELTSMEIDLVHMYYDGMVIERDIAAGWAALSLRSQPKPERICKRCHQSLPKEAYDPRKRICRSCRT